jgi:hypothetical protein
MNTSISSIRPSPPEAPKLCNLSYRWTDNHFSFYFMGGFLIMLTFPKECTNCHFSKAKVSCKSVEKVCGCTKPELGTKIYTGIGDYGLCKNCGHYVIRTSKSWEHHRKAFYCDHPYCDNKCFAPVDVIALLEPPKVPEKENKKMDHAKEEGKENPKEEIKEKQDNTLDTSVSVEKPQEPTEKESLKYDALIYMLDNRGLSDIEE